MAKTKLGKIHAILGRSHRTGRWRLSPKTSVVALLGSCRLDLREAQLDGDVSKMTATVFLGGVTIIIPPGVEVRPSGLSLLGGATVDVPPFDDGPEVALIEIEWTSIFGRLRIGDDTDGQEELDEEATEAPSPPEREEPVAPAPNAAPAEAPTAPPAIGFEDLDDPTPTEPTQATQTEPAPAIGFEDLDDPTPTEATETDETPNRRKDDLPGDGDHAEERGDGEEEATAAVDDSDGTDSGAESDDSDEEPAAPPAAVGFEDL